MTTTNETKSLTSDQILDCAAEILAELEQPIRLSMLGQELNKRLGTSIRQALGHRPLADVILERFADQYEVQGFGPHKEIGRKGTWQYSQKYPHYVSSFWENFERPLEAEHRRWLLPNQTRAVDTAVEPTVEGKLEIESHFILDPTTDQTQRCKLVRHSISTWAKAHDVDLSAYEMKTKTDGEQKDRSVVDSLDAAGVRALKVLVEAVPPGERSRYTLSLDLISRLLNFS